MDMPIELKNAAEDLISGINPQKLRKIAADLSDRYRVSDGSNKKLLTEDIEAMVYSLVRMPATYGAAASAFKYSLEFYDGEPLTSHLDVGAGSGAVAWAVNSFNDGSKVKINNVTCLEREGAMRKIGMELMKSGEDVLQNTKWISADLTSNDSLAKIDNFDLVTESYVLNELPANDRHKVLDNLWDKTGKMLLLVEPGSKIGYSVLKDIRSYMLGKGADLIAPCPNIGECQLDDNDWCHFTCRVQRSRIHKLLKDGDVPYEDEKFIYMCFVKPYPDNRETRRCSGRILRHPMISKGQIGLELCLKDEIKSVNVRKRDGEAFKVARKAGQGDSFEFIMEE